MLTGRQIREARRLLGWSPDQLVKATMLSLDAVTRAEMRETESQLNVTDVARIRRALEAAGVEFVPERGGVVDVRLRKPA